MWLNHVIKGTQAPGTHVAVRGWQPGRRGHQRVTATHPRPERTALSTFISWTFPTCPLANPRERV